MRTIKREIVVALILSSDNKLLMVKKDPNAGGVYLGYWHLPGGGVEKGETEIQALEREVKEEVGLDISSYNVEVVDYNGWGTSKKTLKETKEIVLAKMHFKVYKIISKYKESKDISIALNNELVEFRWVSLDELKTLRVTPPSVPLFEKLGYINRG